MPSLTPECESINPNARVYQAYVSSGAAGLPVASIQDLRPRLPYLRHLVRKHFPPDKSSSIVDLGCGYGALLYVAQQEGYRNIRGVDVSAEQVELSRKLKISSVEHGDIFGFIRAQASNSADAIITFDIIEHLTKSEIVRLADEIYRVLNDGGRWLIHAPNGESPFFGRILYGDFTHEMAFTTTSLSALLKVCKFSDVAFYEDAPIAHGVKSFIRLVLWKVLRTILRLYLAIETGDSGNRAIFSQNFVAVARASKAASDK